MNVHDSQYISGIMEDIGYDKTTEMDKADVIIVNTCAIRENAHNKAEGMLGRIKHVKEEKENVIVIFCGCMAQEEGLVNKIKGYKWIDIICGTHNYHKIPEYLSELSLGRVCEVYIKQEMLLKIYQLLEILNIQHGLIFNMGVISFVLIV